MQNSIYPDGPRLIYFHIRLDKHLATYDIIYFRVINFLKIALPLFGVSLIIAMFLMSRDQAAQAVLPFDNNEFAEELAKQQINKIYYSGQTDAGDELSLSAQSVVEGFEGQKVLEMKTVSEMVKSKNGLEINDFRYRKVKCAKNE